MQQDRGCASWALPVIGGGGAALVMLPGQAVVWLGEQLTILGGGVPPVWYGPVGSLVVVGLTALPLAGLAALAREPASRATLRAWLLACGVAACLAPVRALPAGASQAAMLAQALICLALA
ncbi:MAG TPA: hypothetical protein VNL77_12105, partial [Roseiflexaceae bacterium]|nr:hypothetical protein [Roseiflexaceae bacterium]